jgi:tRNA pseudouridine38-40 synthase
MVRNIVGTLIEIGWGNWPPEQMKAILKSKNRRLAGPTAPSRGLCLVKVVYGKKSSRKKAKRA